MVVDCSFLIKGTKVLQAPWRQRGASGGSLAAASAEALRCHLGALVVAASNSAMAVAMAQRRWRRQLGCGSGSKAAVATRWQWPQGGGSDASVAGGGSVHR